jgi:ribosomal protein S18 acetylase RimI-like enzyme
VRSRLHRAADGGARFGGDVDFGQRRSTMQREKAIDHLAPAIAGSSDPKKAGGEMTSIRRAVAADAQKIGAVFDAAVREGWTYLGELARNPMFPPDEWDQLVVEHAPPNVLLVAVDESEAVVGFTAVHPRQGEMYLLFVHPAHAGRGVGRALLHAAHEALRTAGCREAFLYTHEDNERALSVYEAAGYRRDGSVRESDFRGVHLRELRLVKLL